MNATIRKLEPNDRAAWQQLFEAYIRFYESSLSPEQYDLTWTRLLDPLEPMHCFVAVENGRLVGFTHAIFHRSTWLPDVACTLQDLYVDASQRGKGTGEALIDAVAGLARAHKAGRLYWLTHETNDTARRLYDRVAQNSGFIQYRKPL